MTEPKKTVSADAKLSDAERVTQSHAREVEVAAIVKANKKETKVAILVMCLPFMSTWFLAIE
jgi:hypothetical protein